MRGEGRIASARVFVAVAFLLFFAFCIPFWLGGWEVCVGSMDGNGWVGWDGMGWDDTMVFSFSSFDPLFMGFFYMCVFGVGE